MTTITLTCDNGSHPDVTHLVFATPRRHGILSTFFVIGNKPRDRRALAERAHAEGHWIGNHTYNHLVPLGLASEPGAATSEIARTQELIGNLAYPRRFFQPADTSGVIDRSLLNEEAVEHLTWGDYTCVLWNVIPRDWTFPTVGPSLSIARSILSSEKYRQAISVAEGA